MKRKLLTFFAVFTAIGAVNSQNQLIGPANGSLNIRHISSNGQYVVGANTGKQAYIWDVSAGNTLQLLGPQEAMHVTDSKVVALNANDPNLIAGGSSILSGAVWDNGTFTYLGLGILEGEEPYSSLSGSSVWSATADGKTVVGNSKTYVPHPDFPEDPTKKQSRMWPYSFTYNEGTTKWEGRTWIEPDNVKRNSSIITISGDGSLAAGWTELEGAAARKAIIWTSPTDYQLIDENQFPWTEYTEYICLSPNGKYAGIRGSGKAVFQNLETNTYVRMPTDIGNGTFSIVNGVSDNGIAVGAYAVGNTEGVNKGFIYSEELGFMDFKDFAETYLKDITFPAPFQAALNPATLTNHYSLMAITPDGKNIVVQLVAPRIQQIYIIKLEGDIVVTPFPKNLSATVSRPDRNKVELTWEAPTGDLPDALRHYVIYLDDVELAVVEPSAVSYTHENVPAGYLTYTIKAVYNNDVESRKSDKVSATVVDSYSLPFAESFLSEDFLMNFWTISKDAGRSTWYAENYMGVNASEGALLELSHSQGFVSTSLVSKPLDATAAENVYVSYMALAHYFIDRDGFSADTLYIDVSSDGEYWIEADKFVFPADPYMDWIGRVVDISANAAGRLFNIRLRVEGENQSVDTKRYFFDDITVTTTLPNGDAVPQNIISKDNNDMVELAWQDAGGVYGLTHSTHRMDEYTNQGVPFIAVQSFNADELAIYRDKELYLTSISAYIAKVAKTPIVDTQLKLAVFKNGVRVADQDITTYLENDWNTFMLDTPILIDADITDLKFGIDVVAHDINEGPIGVDEAGRAVAGKGDLYSIDGGTSWLKLSDRETTVKDQLNRNFCIIGNVSENESTFSTTATRTPNILGYNVYLDGVQLNSDLIYEQTYTTEKVNGCYTVRGYSLATGLSALSDELCLDNTGIENGNRADEFLIYPNPVKDYLYINGEFSNVKIYDLTGKLVSETKVSPVYVGGLANGMYLVSIQTETGIITKKLMVRK